MTGGAVETRKASIDLPWAPESPESDGEADNEAEEEQDDGEVEEDDEMDEEEADAADEDDSDDVEEEPEPPAALSGKQKRKRVAEKEAKSRKKVSFGPDPKTSKQARSAGSLQKKPTAAVKEKPLKVAAPKKAANTAVKTKQSQKGSAASSGPGQEYNFGEFF